MHIHAIVVSTTKLWEAGEDHDLSLLLPSCCQALEIVGGSVFIQWALKVVGGGRRPSTTAKLLPSAGACWQNLNNQYSILNHTTKIIKLAIFKHVVFIMQCFFNSNENFNWNIVILPMFPLQCHRFLKAHNMYACTILEIQLNLNKIVLCIFSVVQMYP